MPVNKNVSCEASTAPANTGTATATDNCDASPLISHTEVTDVLGTVKEMKTNVPANSIITLGNNYRPGTYFIELQQGKDRRQLKLIKL